MSKGLGKGLGALMSMFDDDMEELTNNKIRQTPTASKNTEAAEARGPQEVDINLIDNNIGQPRRDFNTEEMRELEQSIAAHGVLQPILLNKVGSRFMIVAGERRWRAAKAVGLKTIPALVRNYTPRQIAEIALVENLMRSDLNEIEVALGIKRLMDTYLMTQEQVSTVLGKSRSAVANSLRLLNLPQEVQTLLEQKKVTIGHAKCLAALTDKNHAISLARKCAEGNMTVRELEAITSGKQIVPRGTFGAASTPPSRPRSLELRELELMLTQAFATKISIQGDDHRGKIMVEYSSQKDLERIKSKIRT